MSRMLNAINAATKAVRDQIKAALDASSNVRIRSGNFNGTSQTIYTDEFVSFQWDATNRQMQYVIPATAPSLGSWVWHDSGVLLIQGAASTVTAQADDTSNLTGTFYFTNNGTLNTAFNMAGFGAKAFYHLVKETRIANWPSYNLEVLNGNSGNVSWLLRITNGDQLA